MAFQFLCPQGHLLQGEESQAGQACQCPMCGMQFLIPSPMPAAQPAVEPTPAAPTFAPTAPPSFAPPPGPGPGEFVPAGPPSQPRIDEAFPSFAPRQEQFPQVGAAPRAAADEVPTFAAGTSNPLPMVHVVCPSGHTLETPREMLGDDAMCPFCQVAFRLRWEDSLEYRKAKEEEMLLREQRLGKAWLQWSIAIAIVVVVGLIVLAVITKSQ